jgi:hypothetical protein
MCCSKCEGKVKDTLRKVPGKIFALMTPDCTTRLSKPATVFRRLLVSFTRLCIALLTGLCLQSLSEISSSFGFELSSCFDLGSASLLCAGSHVLF